LWRPTSARNSCRESAAPESASLAQTAASAASFLLLLARSGRADLEAHRLELAGDLLDLLRPELLLGDEARELGRVDPPTLLGALDDRLQLVGLEQFDELVLRQPGVSVLSHRSAEHNVLRLYARSFGLSTGSKRQTAS
jgi:hypothetical protein